MTKMGVSELRVPVKELSSLVSARQNKKAGKKLPSNPDRITSNTFSFGIFLQDDQAKGNKIIPPAKSRRAATCHGFKCFRPISISKKLLPHIKHSITNMAQLINLLLIYYRNSGAKVMKRKFSYAFIFTLPK
jgi:hypothetical protein